MVNIGGCSIRVHVTRSEGSRATFVLAMPICAAIEAAVSISRKVKGGHWRLIGAGKILSGVSIPVLDSE